MIKEINVTTGDELVREFTDAELLELENSAKESEKLKQAELNKEAARQAVLDKLGLTADQAKLLLGL